MHGAWLFGVLNIGFGLNISNLGCTLYNTIKKHYIYIFMSYFTDTPIYFSYNIYDPEMGIVLSYIYIDTTEAM